MFCCYLILEVTALRNSEYEVTLSKPAPEHPPTERTLYWKLEFLYCNGTRSRR